MRYGWAALMVGLLAVQAFGAEDTLESVEKTVSGKINALKGLSYKFTHHVAVENGGVKITLDQEGTCQYKHDGELWWMRYDSKGTEVNGGESIPREELRVVNATDHYALTLNKDKKSAGKFGLIVGLCPPGGATNFANLSKAMASTLRPSEKVGEEECYVIEWSAKNAGGFGKSQISRYYYSKASGFLLQSMVYDGSGKELDRWTFKEHKADPDLADDVFKLEIPEGTPYADYSEWKPGDPTPKETPYKKK